MNQNIIRMARKVWGESAVLPFNELEQFAALVAAAERDECAKLVITHPCEERSDRRTQIAKAIRARGQQ